MGERASAQQPVWGCRTPFPPSLLVGCSWIMLCPQHFCAPSHAGPTEAMGGSGPAALGGVDLRSGSVPIRVIRASLLCFLLASPGPGSLCTSLCCSCVAAGRASAVIWSHGPITLYLCHPQSLPKSVGCAQPLCPKTARAMTCHPFLCRAAGREHGWKQAIETLSLCHLLAQGWV